MGLAEEEARHFQHSAIGTEHLLLGLIREEESVAAHVLKSQGVTLERVHKAVEEAKGRGKGEVQGEIGLTPHAETAIEMAIKEADRRFPQTNQPMLGTMYVPESEAVQVLQDRKMPPRWEELGVKLEQVSKAVEEAKGRGNNMVQIQIETGMAPYANKPKTDDWHHPSFHIDTTNLLLGLLRVPESTAVKILQELGAPSLKDFSTLVYLEGTTTLQTANQGYVQRFTSPARKAWSLAHEEVRHLQDIYIGTDHLLLGLAGEGSGVAARVLTEMGVNLEKMREEVKNMSIGGGEGLAPSDIKLQPKLQDDIELASNEARRLNHRSIGTGHLLLVLARGRDGHGMEAGMLQRQGVDLDKMRTAILREMNKEEGEAEKEATLVADESSEEGLTASIASIEKDLQNRELDKAILAAYPFTIEAQHVLENARMHAKQFAQRVEPEHLLLGLAELTFKHEGTVSKALKELGIDYAEVRAVVEKRQGQGVKDRSVVLVQSALCRAYLLFAADEAEQKDGLGAPIKSEHLLLGLLREEKGIIADLLGELGTSVGAVRAKVLELQG